MVEKMQLESHEELVMIWISIHDLNPWDIGCHPNKYIGFESAFSMRTKPISKMGQNRAQLAGSFRYTFTILGQCRKMPMV